ncbi:hypothetical protein D9M70_504060 [compost metagenome]
MSWLGERLHHHAVGIGKQHRRLAIGQRTVDGADQEVDRFRLMLDDAIEHAAPEDLFARLVVEGCGEDDGRHLMGKNEFERLAIGRVRQVEVEHGEREAFRRLLQRFPERRKRAAMGDADAVDGLEPVFQRRREHPGIFDKEHALVAVLLHRIQPAWRAAQSHVPATPLEPQACFP